MRLGDQAHGGPWNRAREPPASSPLRPASGASASSTKRESPWTSFPAYKNPSDQATEAPGRSSDPRQASDHWSCPGRIQSPKARAAGTAVLS